LLASMYGLHKLEQFVIRDTRFALNGPEGSWETPTLEIVGATHASQRQLEAMFTEDAGRSVYLLPLNDRRTSLRTANWVRDASIERIWPNRVVVRIAERTPVAYVSVGSSRSGMIDEDGVILPPSQDRFKLPGLLCVRPSDPIDERRKRVHRMQRLMRELGDAAANISDIDVSDPDNLKIIEPWDGRMFTLMIGDHAFAQRHANFVNNYSEIKHRTPGATTLDLRLEDRITAVE
jgi:cell division protein FtsQ